MQVLLRLAIAAWVVFAGPAAAQQQAKPAAANARQTQKTTFNVAMLVVLIKGTVMALHQANVTGNYSVLRDLGTPVFRERFDQAALTQAFANLRVRKLDLSPMLVVKWNSGETGCNGRELKPGCNQNDLKRRAVSRGGRISNLSVIPARELLCSVAPPRIFL